MTAQHSGADARHATVDRIRRLGAVAVVRLPSSDAAMKVVDALHEGGVLALEITATVPDALAVISVLARRFGDEVCLGVGTVLDATTARDAVSAGARYVVSPVFRHAVVTECQRLGVPVMPGAYTPTEALAAHEAGADIVKIFPSDTLGPGYLRSLLAPMPFLRLMPTGGVTPENVGAWLAAGAVAVGLGGALVDRDAVSRGDWAAITARARRVTDGVAAYRASHRTGSAG